VSGSLPMSYLKGSKTYGINSENEHQTPTDRTDTCQSWHVLRVVPGLEPDIKLADVGGKTIPAFPKNILSVFAFCKLYDE
jgi:hypothetical protein